MGLIVDEIVSVFDIDNEELYLDWYRSENSFMSKAFTTVFGQTVARLGPVQVFFSQFFILFTQTFIN